jgi:hypothetical protein
MHELIDGKINVKPERPIEIVIIVQTQRGLELLDFHPYFDVWHNCDS